MKYKINEIFDSLQGEGANLGKEVTFIRLAGCNLSCEWCDTEYNTYKELNIAEILNLTGRSAILTGGEPTIHQLIPLLKELRKKGIWTGMETNGTNDITEIRKYVNYIAFSPKGITHNSLKENADEIRIVNVNLQVEDVLKYEDWKIKNRFISPLDTRGDFNLLETVKLIGKINEGSRHNWRMSLQMHKILNVK